MKSIFLIFTFLIFLMMQSCYACQFDTDCQPGSKCVKSNGNINGWCVGGLQPGNENDQRPASDPTDITHKKGNTCSFDTDCGPGGKCFKGASIYGTCL